MSVWPELGSPELGSLVLFVLGWSAGWLLLWRPRRLPVTSGRRTSAVSVIVPARDEAGSIAAVVTAVRADLAVGDQIIVVDDHSSDDTAALAAAAGAVVIASPELPRGWAGKAHACHVGASHASGDVLVFVDADVTIAPGTMDSLVAEVERSRAALVSVQPWHRTERPVEQVSLLFNVVALMGSAGFSLLGARVSTHVAFGPVLACRRDEYARVGGHAHPDVRGAILEDIALARRFPRSQLFAGRSGGVSFRMYPDGFRQAVEGWTKGAGIGVDATPWWALLGVIAWVSSLAGGWLTSPWFAVASALQLAVLARWVGRFRWWAIALFPLALVAFVAIVARSVWRRRSGRHVTWKGRALVPDQSTDAR